MPNFYEVKFEPQVEQWMQELEEIIGTLDADERIKISRTIFAEIWREGYASGIEHQSAVRGQER